MHTIHSIRKSSGRASSNLIWWSSNWGREMAIEQQIEEILKRELPGAQVDIERDADTGMVGGHVIWAGFTGYKSLRRQNRIFSLLRRQLSTADAMNISFIFTYTPEEYDQL